MNAAEQFVDYGIPGLCIVLTASSLALIIRLIQRNGCLLKIRSCCSTEDPCMYLDCNKGREKPTYKTNASNSSEP